MNRIGHLIGTLGLIVFVLSGLASISHLAQVSETTPATDISTAACNTMRFNDCAELDTSRIDDLRPKAMGA